MDVTEQKVRVHRKLCWVQGTVDNFGCCHRLEDGACHLLLRHGRQDGGHAGGDVEAPEMCTELVHVPVHQLGGVEYAVPSAPPRSDQNEPHGRY